MRKQLTALRNLMAQKGIDAYIIPTTDFHGSEYVNDYFKCRKYISGFTGSAGTLVITQTEAYLWTDGRYFLQAAAQLTDSGIGLMKMGEPGVPTILEYLKEHLSQEQTIGFDGRVIDFRLGCELEKIAHVSYDMDLAGDVWPNRPSIRPSSIYPLHVDVTGETTASKLSRVRSVMKDKNADYHLITKLEDIAWLFNLRGRDVANTPVFFAFSLITQTRAFLYVMDESFTGEDVRPYFQIFEDVKTLHPGRILLDDSVVSYALIRSLPPDVEVIPGSNPTELMKALKNETEISCTKNAHLKDGVAMIKFICWLKESMAKYKEEKGNTETISEISAADYLEQCRRQQAGCYDLSFSTISGYMENGAIIHYDPTEETNKTLKPEGFLLVDSGGQYEDGTTDITRTIVLGPLSQQMKEHYTAVLRCHIALADCRFPAATSGAVLDELARRPLRAIGLDYNHGTGHGVGHLLSVHEGPQTISTKAGNRQVFYPGMITSNEPGVYLENQYGIRLENEILCVEEESGMLKFETITWCPFERDAVLPQLMTQEELDWLNRYHAEVYGKIAPRLDAHTAAWLKEQTAPITL